MYAKLQTDVKDFFKDWFRRHNHLPTTSGISTGSCNCWSEGRWNMIFDSSMKRTSVRPRMMHMSPRKVKRGKRNPVTRIQRIMRSPFGQWTCKVYCCFQKGACIRKQNCRSFFDLRSKEEHCYICDEFETDLSREVFVHLQCRHFQGVIKDHLELKKIIMWSNGCGHQNHNACVANAFSWKEIWEIITQKYLVAGHTRMECDSMDSTIEPKTVLESHRLEKPYHHTTDCKNQVIGLPRECTQAWWVSETDWILLY